MRVPLFALAFSLAVPTLGCSAGRERLGPPSSCEGEGCPTNGGTGTPGGGAGGSGGAGGEGGASAGDVSGLVLVLGEETFTQGQTFTGGATVYVPGATGGDATGTYDGSSFTVAGAALGVGWCYVAPNDAAAGVLATFSLADVSTSATLVLPVLDLALLTSLYASLPAPETVDPSASQVILFLSRGGVALEGASVDVGGGATVAYDDGLGVYSPLPGATGPDGVALVINAAPPVADLTLAVTDDVGTLYQLELPAAPGAVTFAGFELE